MFVVTLVTSRATLLMLITFACRDKESRWLDYQIKSNTKTTSRKLCLWNNRKYCTEIFWKTSKSLFIHIHICIYVYVYILTYGSYLLRARHVSGRVDPSLYKVLSAIESEKIVSYWIRKNINGLCSLSVPWSLNSFHNYFLSALTETTSQLNMLKNSTFKYANKST